MSRTASDRTVLGWAAAVALPLAFTPGLASAQTQPDLRGIVSNEIAVSRREAALRLELDGGRTVDVAIRDGKVYSDGNVIGTAQRNSALDRSWRALLNEAIDAPADDLAGLV
jgi:hypothetical protein